MDPTCVFNFFYVFWKNTYKSNCIIFIFSWFGTHTKIRSKLVVIVTVGSQKITLWGPQRNPLGILRVKQFIFTKKKTLSYFCQPAEGMTTAVKFEVQNKGVTFNTSRTSIIHWTAVLTITDFFLCFNGTEDARGTHCTISNHLETSRPRTWKTDHLAELRRDGR